jgi:hypothetical protein
MHIRCCKSLDLVLHADEHTPYLRSRILSLTALACTHEGKRVPAPVRIGWPVAMAGSACITFRAAVTNLANSVADVATLAAPRICSIVQVVDHEHQVPWPVLLPA